MTTSNNSAAESVKHVADRQIEAIRLLLCPEKSDVDLVDDGSLDTVLRIDCDVEFRYSTDFAASYRDEDGTLDLDEMVEDCWDEIRDECYERFHEHGLSFDYVMPDDSEHYFCYLISTGGPGTEIRFYANHDLTLYRAEFWLLEWFDGACVTVTSDATVQALWEQFADCGTADYVRRQAIKDLG